MDYVHGFALALRQAAPGTLDVEDARPALDLYLEAVQAAARRKGAERVFP